MTTATIDLDRLLRLRLVAARLGEMGLATWWNTRGQLARLGAGALRRCFPRTDRFAQVASVFVAAAQRCVEIFHRPVMEHIDPIYFGEPKTAAVKALGG